MSSFHLRALILGLAMGFGGAGALGDVVHLKDGGTLEGIVKHSEDGWIVRTGTKTIHVLAQDVESIELTPATNPSPLEAGERLASLRRSVESLGDLNEIVARFQRFVDQGTDAATTADARKDLAIWQDRLQQKMVKVGSKWVTAADRDKLVEQAAASAETARQLMKQGRSKEAEPLLAGVVETDPQNATALYLIGILRYQQEQLPAARKAFEATDAIIPNHAPTLNNLGVVQWRQHQFIAALQSFDAAMLSRPGEKTILDNVLVALQQLPADLQKSPVTIKAARHFSEQDQKLAEQMARAGMHRYGSLWVSDNDMAQIRAQEKQIQDQLDQLSGQFDRATQHVDQLTNDIADDQSQMDRIASSSYAIDPRTGVAVSMPLPSTYYDLQHDIQRLQRVRDSEASRLDMIKKQAQDLQKSRPSVRSQAVMVVIGAEGTPIRIAAPANAVGK